MGRDHVVKNWNSHRLILEHWVRIVFQPSKFSKFREFYSVLQCLSFALAEGQNVDSLLATEC